MLKKILKYFSYVLLIFIVLWGIVISGSYLYFKSAAGQKFLVAYIQKTLKNSGQIEAKVENIKGKIPFSFSIGTIELKKDQERVAKIEDFYLNCYWKSLLQGRLDIDTISAKKVHIYLAQKKIGELKEKKTQIGAQKIKKIAAVQKKTPKNKERNTSWPLVSSLPISINVEQVYLREVAVYKKKEVLNVSKVRGTVFLSKLANLDFHLKAKVIRPDIISLQVHSYIPLSKKQAKVVVHITKNKYATGTVKGLIFEKNPSAIAVDGSLEAKLNKNILGPASALIGLLKLDFNLLYKKDELDWKIKGGDGGLAHLDEKGTYKGTQSLWENIMPIISSGINKLVKNTIAKSAGKKVEKLKNKLIKKISKHLPKDAGIKNAVESAVGALQKLF